LAFFLSLIGEADSAKIELDRAVSDSAYQYQEPGFLWRVYAALGEKDEAFVWLERGIGALAPFTAYLGVTPSADPLRDDPRYQAILDRIGLGHLKQRFDSLAASAGSMDP
jgi:hypothetical protein